MALNAPYLPLNPLRPRVFGGKGAEGVKKEIPSNKVIIFAIVSANLLLLEADSQNTEKKEIHAKASEFLGDFLVPESEPTLMRICQNGEPSELKLKSQYLDEEIHFRRVKSLDAETLLQLKNLLSVHLATNSMMAVCFTPEYAIKIKNGGYVMISIECSNIELHESTPQNEVKMTGLFEENPAIMDISRIGEFLHGIAYP